MGQNTSVRLALLNQMIASTERRIAFVRMMRGDGGPYTVFLTNLLRDEQMWLASLRRQVETVQGRTV